MTTRYDDRNYDRNYDRDDDDSSRSRSEYGRSYSGKSEGRYRSDESDRESGRYGREGEYQQGYGGQSKGQYRQRGYSDEYGGRYSSRGSRETGPGGEYSGRYSSSGRDPYRGEEYAYGRWETEGGSSGSRNRSYGSSGRSYSDEGRYGRTSDEYSQRYNYPQSWRTESYRDRAGREYQGGQYWGGQQRGYEGERGRGYGEEERGWWDRTSDEIASWFGDREAERRRQMDRQREFRGRGPKGYRRSDERIKEDVNDRLSEGYLDATEIEVLVVDAEVTLTGTVNSRDDKRLAEDIADSVSGVSNVENRLRVTQSSLDRPPLGTSGREMAGTSQATGTTGSATSTGTTGTTGTTTAGTTGRGKGAGT
jgi:osmotically-inducible protein OsmY